MHNLTLTKFSESSETSSFIAYLVAEDDKGTEYKVPVTVSIADFAHSTSDAEVLETLRRSIVGGIADLNRVVGSK